MNKIIRKKYKQKLIPKLKVVHLLYENTLLKITLFCEILDPSNTILQV